jgi:ABC-2 type transport system ATP-binding protein
MSLKVQQLTKIYGTQRAVSKLDFEAQAGQITGFLGPNGAGKSTTMKIITGYISATSGEVEVCGKKVSEEDKSIRKHIGYLPEHNPLYLDLYIKEYLRFIGGLHQIKGKKLSERVEQMIELVGLTREKHKKIGALSKGYRQRVGLAQALLHDPAVLILDEPTTGLDPNQILEIRQVIKDISKSKTIVFSTHIMQEVQALCDKVLIINKGEKVWDGRVQDLKDNAGKEWKIFIAFANAFSPQNFEKIEAIQSIKSIEENFCFEITSPNDIRKELFELAVSLQNPILELRKEELNLEAIFRELTQNRAENT